MGMGYAAQYADVMEWDDIKTIVPQEAAAFEAELKAFGITWGDFCRAMSLEDWSMADFNLETAEEVDQATDRIEAAWERLANAFTQVTEGLILTPGYHSSDDGDRYDDLQGGFFDVEGVYQLTPAGQKYADKIARKYFVRFG